jgi:hypothetical protein
LEFKNCDDYSFIPAKDAKVSIYEREKFIYLKKELGIEVEIPVDYLNKKFMKAFRSECKNLYLISKVLGEIKELAYCGGGCMFTPVFDYEYRVQTATEPSYLVIVDSVEKFCNDEKYTLTTSTDKKLEGTMECNFNSQLKALKDVNSEDILQEPISVTVLVLFKFSLPSASAMTTKRKRTSSLLLKIIL